MHSGAGLSKEITVLLVNTVAMHRLCCVLQNGSGRKHRNENWMDILIEKKKKK